MAGKGQGTFVTVALIAIVSALVWVVTAPLEHSQPTLLWPTRNFLVYGFLAIFLYKKFGTGQLRARRVQIEQFIQKSQSELAQVESELEELDQRLTNISAERVEIAKRFEGEGQRMAQMILQNAQKSAERVRGDVKRQIESEMSSARAEIREMVLQQATDLAREKVRGGLSPQQDRELRQSALQGLFE